MEQELVKILIDLGLGDKEAKVYLAAIEVGTAPVSQIAQKARINRVTTYDILEKLKSKGLVSFFTKAKIKYFTATNPETLLETYEKRTNELRTCLPKFKRLTGETNHPRVRYFEGLEGIKAIYADTLTAKTEILNYSNSAEIRKTWPAYDEEYVQKRAEKKIFLRGLSPKDKAGEVVEAENEKYHREIRLIPSDQFNFTNEINIYDDKMAIISFEEQLIGMIIESKEIATSQRAIFNMCWQFANLKDGLAAKTKMLEPIKENELKTNMEREAKPPKKDSEAKDSTKNLSLF